MEKIDSIRVLNIDTDSTDNGEGLRTVIYVSGCWHACKGCHNLFSWRPKNGEPTKFEDIVDIINQNPLADVTISGGDPLTFQHEETIELLKTIKKETGKNIWLYTGYDYEEIFKEGKEEALEYIDVLVVGRFILSKRDLTTVFRGSSNQKLVDVPKSREEGRLVEYEIG